MTLEGSHGWVVEGGQVGAMAVYLWRGKGSRGWVFVEGGREAMAG